jgi:uncharacterized protein YeaO (DUF488 family)
MDTKRLRRFAGKYLARQMLRAKDKELTEWIAKEQKELIEHLVDDGVDKVSLRQGITIFTRTTIWAKMLKPKDEVIRALKDCVETKELIGEDFNSLRLSSYLRELENSNKELPEELKDVIEGDAVSNLIAKRI